MASHGSHATVPTAQHACAAVTESMPCESKARKSHRASPEDDRSDFAELPDQIRHATEHANGADAARVVRPRGSFATLYGQDTNDFGSLLGQAVARFSPLRCGAAPSNAAGVSAGCSDTAAGCLQAPRVRAQGAPQNLEPGNTGTFVSSKVLLPSNVANEPRGLTTRAASAPFACSVACRI